MIVNRMEVGRKVHADSIKVFDPCEWNGRILIKMRKRTANIIDMWDMERNMPEYLMPETPVRTVQWAKQMDDGPVFLFGNYPQGEMFAALSEPDTTLFMKAWPYGTDLSHEDALNAYDVVTGSYMHIAPDYKIRAKTMSNVIITAER